jgi:hypothetical protein
MSSSPSNMSPTQKNHMVLADEISLGGPLSSQSAAAVCGIALLADA